MKKILTLAICAMFAGVVAAAKAPAKKDVVVAEAAPVVVEEDCTKITDETLKKECEAKKAVVAPAAEEVKK